MVFFAKDSLPFSVSNYQTTLHNFAHFWKLPRGKQEEIGCRTKSHSCRRKGTLRKRCLGWNSQPGLQPAWTSPNPSVLWLQTGEGRDQNTDLCVCAKSPLGSSVLLVWRTYSELTITSSQRRHQTEKCWCDYNNQKIYLIFKYVGEKCWQVIKMALNCPFAILYLLEHLPLYPPHPTAPCSRTQEQLHTSPFWKIFTWQEA